MLDSGFAEFKIDYLKIKDFAIGAREISESISVSGHPWRIFCYPRGRGLDGKGEYLSIFLQLASNDAKNVRAIFEAFLTDKDGAPSSSVAQSITVSKQGHPPLMERRTIDSAFHEIRINYEQTRHLPIGKAIFSDAFSAGGHMWRIMCFPRGTKHAGEGNYVAIFAELVCKSKSVNAIFEAFLVGKDGHPSSTNAKRTIHLFQSDEDDWGWLEFVSHTDLIADYVIDGHFTVMCGVIVISDRSISVPPSDIGKHLGTLLDSTDGTDVSFIIDSETFHAHRAVLAAHSPVFRAELLGSMAEAAMSTITLHDIAPATFKVMLQFIYTDVFPGDKELGESPSEMVQHLLAAADRYALDRLKLMCAQKLWSDVSVHTVASTLACAEMYNCPDLKKNCIDFFAVEKNFKKAVLTPGFVQLVQQCPSIIDELREKTGT
ncbi:hypothetical protein EJB05_48139, partial [Eragrostis curvula]